MIRLYRFLFVLPLMIAALIGKSEPVPNLVISLSTPTFMDAPVFSEKEIICVRDMVYGESGSEPFEGKVAAASVAIYRSLAAAFPDNLCDVVKEPNQFYGYKRQAHSDARFLEESRRSVDYAIRHLGELPVTHYFHRKEIKGNYEYQYTVGNHTFYRPLHRNRNYVERSGNSSLDDPSPARDRLRATNVAAAHAGSAQRLR